MPVVSTTRLRKALTKWRVPTHYVPDWSSARINPYRINDMQGIVLHHTAGTDSLAYCVRGTYPPVRNCHFLVAHDGTVNTLSGTGAYHAGKGGPWAITKRLVIPKDQGNQRLYGIEIESLGTKSAIDGSLSGMTRDQVVSVAYLCAALLDVMRRGPLSYRVGRVIRHRDWAPTRKIDVKQDLAWWRTVIHIAQRHRRDKTVGVNLIHTFIDMHPNGRL